MPKTHRFRIRLIHWNATEAKDRIAALRSAGYKVDFDPIAGPSLLRTIRERPPDLVVIDLNRLPMQGRDTGVALRGFKATREIPLVFVDGSPEKIERIKSILPDDFYTTWRSIRSTLKQAISKPPLIGARPRSALEGYSTTPLVKKLGIKPQMSVALLDPPENFEEILGDLPEGVRFHRSLSGTDDIAILFVLSRNSLEGRIGRLASRLGSGGLWIAWPKKSSGVSSDLSDSAVRSVGLDAGLVDYKVCSIDSTWSAYRFTTRKEKSEGTQARDGPQR